LEHAEQLPRRTRRGSRTSTWGAAGGSHHRI
jgi:hypothetical protein